MEVQFYPTEKSYNILDRWEEAYKNTPDIPYREDLIEALNWKEISDFFYKYDTEFDDDISDYIIGGR